MKFFHNYLSSRVYSKAFTHGHTQMINDARCTVQNNDEWKKNKTKKTDKFKKKKKSCKINI